MSGKPFTHDFRTPLLRILVCVFILGVWQGMCQFHFWDEGIIPAPKDVLEILWQTRDSFWTDLWSTVFLLIIGTLSTIGLAFVTATALHMLPRFSRSVYWLFVLLQTVPLFPLAPIIFYLTGPKHIFLDQVITIVLAAFFPVLVTTTEGLKRADRDLLDVFASLNATRWQKLLHLEIPTALHMVIAGTKITVTMCVIGTFFAETIVGDMKGLGYRIKLGDDHMNVSLVFAGMFLLAIVSASTYWSVETIARLAQPWQRRGDFQ